VTLSAAQLYADLYDDSGVGWPGELDFYQALAATATARGEGVLEVACGTGRVTLPLARTGAQVTGFDRSPEMLRIARAKSGAATNPRWIEADMRSVALGESFGLILIPAHAFQSLLTPDDQVACLELLGRHLTPDGTLVIHLDHQDLDWLGSLPATGPGIYEDDGEVIHAVTGRRLRRLFAWSYQRAGQTATLALAWEEVGPEGDVRARWDLGPTPLHCVFRFEVEHLLARTGFAVRSVYGDFAGQALADDSSEMIWVARKTAARQAPLPGRQVPPPRLSALRKDDIAGPFVARVRQAFS
jgi:SAM-dependent methyltransferase